MQFPRLFLQRARVNSAQITEHKFSMRGVEMIYNLDCIKGSQLLIKEESADLIITDPPYNLGFGGTTQTRTKRRRFNIIANDNLSPKEYQRFTIQWLQQAYRILKPGRHIYVFIDWRMYAHMVFWMRRVGFVIKNLLVWDKMNMGVGWQYRYQHELIIFAVQNSTKVRRVRNRAATDIIRIPKISGNKTVHPTEKPVELMEELVLNSSEPGEMVVDFFLGSGPVTEATLLHGRQLTGFEIDPHYFEMNIERIKKVNNF